jgi:hypothetical protein
MHHNATLARFAGAWAIVCAACAPRAQPELPRAEVSARQYASEAQARFDAGRREEGIRLATRALVTRLAHYGVEQPEPARSFVQLGDMRWRLGQLEWARQCYVRALELSLPHERTHPELVRSAKSRLAALDRVLKRSARSQGGAAP